MIYYATIHWKSDRWIDIQRRMIAENTSVPYKIYAYLNDIDPKYDAHFDVVLRDGDPWHDVKLDRLAGRILTEAQDDDWIIFIDGDAFPINSVTERLGPWLKEYRLVAAQRLENLGEKHPHPSFCATTAGFWRLLNATWAKGYRWINILGYEETDVGGELLGLLVKHNISWKPLVRSNTVHLNTILFGVYGDIVYHHAAGFRNGGCRVIWYDRGVYSIFKRLDARILNILTPARWQKQVRNSLIHPEGRLKHRIAKELKALSNEVYERIRQDPYYPRTLIAPPAESDHHTVYDPATSGTRIPELPDPRK